MFGKVSVHSQHSLTTTKFDNLLNDDSFAMRDLLESQRSRVRSTEELFVFFLYYQYLLCIPVTEATQGVTNLKAETHFVHSIQHTQLMEFFFSGCYRYLVSQLIGAPWAVFVNLLYNKFDFRMSLLGWMKLLILLFLQRFYQLRRRRSWYVFQFSEWFQVCWVLFFMFNAFLYGYLFSIKSQSTEQWYHLSAIVCFLFILLLPPSFYTCHSSKQTLILETHLAKTHSGI